MTDEIRTHHGRAGPDAKRPRTCVRRSDFKRRQYREGERDERPRDCFDRSMWGGKLWPIYAGLAVAVATVPASGQCLEAHFIGQAGGSFGWSVAQSPPTRPSWWHRRKTLRPVVPPTSSSAAAAASGRSKPAFSPLSEEERLIGRAVAIAGDTAVVCAEDRSAYVFVLRSGGAWTEQAGLVPSIGGYSRIRPQRSNLRKHDPRGRTR